MVAHISPVLKRRKQKDQKFKFILGNIVSLRPTGLLKTQFQ